MLNTKKQQQKKKTLVDGTLLAQTIMKQRTLTKVQYKKYITNFIKHNCFGKNTIRKNQEADIGIVHSTYACVHPPASVFFFFLYIIQ